jgi:hemoglobin-like flavoprotein
MLTSCVSVFSIFEIAPQAKALFPFARLYEGNDEALFKDRKFLSHAKGVVSMLDAAVNMLGPDLEPVTKALEDLGARHCQYDVVAEHNPIIGEALLKTLEAALGGAWTPTVKEGWTGIYGFVSSSMQRGAEEFLKEELDAYHEI